MGYDILSDDLYDKGDKNSKKKKFAYEYISKEQKEKNKKLYDKNNSKIESFGETKSKKKKINFKESKTEKFKSFFRNKKMFIINLVLILLLIIVSLFFIFGVNFNFFDSDEIIEISGDSDNFLNEYSGDFILDSHEFDLSIDESNFNIIDNKIEVKNFIGKIEKQGGSFYFTGTANSVKYSDNDLDCKNKTIRIKPEKIFSGEFEFKKLELNLKNGEIEINDVFEFEFKNSSIILENFKTEFEFNKKFEFSGTSKKINLKSSEPKIEFEYFGK